MSKLQGYINDVRSELHDSPLQTFLIATKRENPVAQARTLRVDVQDVLSLDLTAHAQDLVGPLAEAAPPVQNLFTLLGSSDPDVHHYVEELVKDDQVAFTLFKHVSEPRLSARSTVDQLSRSIDVGETFANAVRTIGSDSLDYLGYLASADLEPRATGTWKVGNSTLCTDYSNVFSTIQERANWAKVIQRYQARSRAFPGREKTHNYDTQNLDNAEAIKKTFTNVAKTAAETALQEINKTDAEAVFAKPLSAMTDSNLKDYSKKDNALLFLALNYDEANRDADGYGIMTIEWELSIGNYQRKSKRGGMTHPTKIDVSARYIAYSSCADFSDMCEDFKVITGECAPICQDLKRQCGSGWPLSTPCSP